MLGPLLLTFYTCPVGDIIRPHDLRFQLYADDSQVYICFITADWQDQVAAVHKVEHCLAEIHDWMERNYLKMNDDKTIAVVATPSRHSNHGITVIKLGECDVTPSPSARNIRLVFDSGMLMKQQMTHVCQVAYWHLHMISTIRFSITQDAAVKLVLALVVSRLDFANTLLVELPDCLISRLQKVQNAAARMVAHAGWRDRISPILKRLHWLPIRQRIVYKALVLTFRGLHDLAPKYI